MNKKNIIIFLSIILFVIFVLIFVFVFLKKESVPTHVSAEALSYNEIKITWTGEDNVSQYNIYRKEDRNELLRRVGFSLEEEYIDTNLEENKTYYYAITQVVNFRESDYSAVVEVKTDPGIPKNLKAVAVPFQEELAVRVDLIWDYSIYANYYNIYRSQEKDGYYEKIGTAMNENFSDRGILPGERYYYVITQVIDDREGDFSNKVDVVTDFSWSCGDELRHGLNTYKTIRIGNQCWFQENMNISDNEEVVSHCSITRHCYENDLTMCNRYGGLYNFDSIICNEEGAKNPQGICPLGWRIPSDDDWSVLEIEVGMGRTETTQYGFRGSNEGSKLAGRYDLWEDGFLRQSSVFAFSEFNVLPAGMQPSLNLSVFRGLGEDALFWSSTRANDDEGCRLSGENAYNTREFNYNSMQIKKDCRRKSRTAHLRCMRDY